MYQKMAQFLLLLLCLTLQGSRQQIQRKQLINLGDSFNLEGNDGTEDGFSRALADSSLGGELGNEDNANSQMHISENNQGGISLGQNSDELGSLGSLMGGNSINSFSLNSLSSLGDDLGLGGRGAKDNGLLESLGDTKSFLSGGDQLSNYGDGAKPDMNDESSNLLEAFGLKGSNENKESDNSLEDLLGGGKEKSLMSLLSLGEDNTKTKSQADTLIDGLNLNEADSNNNVENTANLGDSLNMGSNTDLLGLNKNDLAALIGGADGNSHSSASPSSFKASKQNAETNDESLSILQKLINGQGTTNGGDRQGIGDFEDGGGGLSNELNQLDTVDDKLEKMLEGLGKVDAGATQSSNHEDYTAQQDSQPSDAVDEMPAAGYYQHNGQMQTMGHEGGGYDRYGNMMNGINIGGMTNGGIEGGFEGDETSNMLQGIAGGQTGVQHIGYGETIRVHASDNTHNSDQVSQTQAKQKAEQVQKNTQLKHEAKLKKLKGRLAALKQKLEELQEEQSKKSQNVDSPKARRKEAIKRLLIKNLKLAAVIASKEIQLEEAKESAFTGKKETDDLSLLDVAKNVKETPKTSDSTDMLSKTKAKPLTDLSKKAEEEVNHLIKAQGISKMRRDKSLPVSQGKDTTTKKENTEDKDNNKQKGKTIASNATIIEQINATLAKLSASSPKNISVTPKAYKKLVQRITQLSPKKSQAVQEAALSSLYKALMKSQPTVSGNSKKLSIKYINIGCYKDNTKRAISSLESSFKSPLDKNYKTRLNSLYKCARIAKLKGFPGFALENGGQCFGEKDILNKYKTYGASHTCGMGGKGGVWSLNVYKFA